MKIPLREDVNLVRQWPYKLNPKYKEKVEKIYKMLQEGIIEPIKESEWISPIVIQEKRKGGIRLSMDLRKLNDSCVIATFSTLFMNEVLQSIGGQEAYSFTDGF